MFSLRKQREEEASISLTYTISHIVKLLAVLLNGCACLIILAMDLVNGNPINIIENTAYTFLWAFSIVLMRREFLKLGKTSNYLLGFWAFMLITPATALLIEMDFNESDKNIRHVLKLASLVINTFLVIFCLIKRTDIEDIYSRSTSAYKKLLKSYFVEEESILSADKLWDKWDNLSDASVPIIERENIKSIFIKGTKDHEFSEGTVSFFTIQIEYGKTKDLKREVLRRYREFLHMFNELKLANPNTVFPDFPRLTRTRNEVTKDVIKERGQLFNQIFNIIVTERLNCPELNRFLSKSPELEMTDVERRGRIMSTVQETEFTAIISKAVKEETKFATQARYEVVVRCGKYSITTHHLFSDFKALHKSLSKKHKNLDEIPPSHVTKSSANPLVVKERKVKLQGFLNSLLSDPFTKADIETIRFINLDAII